MGSILSATGSGGDTFVEPPSHTIFCYFGTKSVVSAIQLAHAFEMIPLRSHVKRMKTSDAKISSSVLINRNSALFLQAHQ